VNVNKALRPLRIHSGTIQTSGVHHPQFLVVEDALAFCDLPAITTRINKRTRAIFIINPPLSDTVNDNAACKVFLRAAARQVRVIVDKAYQGSAQCRKHQSAWLAGHDTLVHH